MSEQIRNLAPTTLAEKLAAPGGKCPIPFTHDRLHEAHHWWHEMARWYHEPQEFRYGLGAFLQAARSVSFMLQNEKSAFRDFSWYDDWAIRAGRKTLLKWVKDMRTEIVHQKSLEPHSWLRIHCLGENPTRHGFDDEEEPYYSVSPFECTHYYIETGIQADHAHEFERYWSVESLPGRELLQACAEIFDELNSLVGEAHKRLGASWPSHRGPDSLRDLPCMEDLLRHRIVRTFVKDGREIWQDEPPGLHPH